MTQQNIIITKSVYYYMGLMNILSLLYKRIVIIEGIHGEYFPDLKTSWVTPWTNVISPILNSFGLAKMMNNAMPDKPDEQGDGSITPWTTNRTPADLQSMYNLLNDASITFNTTEPINATLDLMISDPSGYQQRAYRCNSILGAYETIHEIENTIYMISLSITPLYRVTGTVTDGRSPGQIMTIAGDTFNKPYLFDMAGNGTVYVLWSKIDEILDNYFSTKYLGSNILESDIPLISHNETEKVVTLAYVTGDTMYDFNIIVTDEIPIAAISIVLSGRNAADDDDIETTIKTNWDGWSGSGWDDDTPPIATGNVGIYGNKLYIGSNYLDLFLTATTVTCTAMIVYYEE